MRDRRLSLSLTLHWRLVKKYCENKTLPGLNQKIVGTCDWQ